MPQLCLPFLFRPSFLSVLSFHPHLAGTVDLGLVPVDLGLVPVDLGLAPVDLGLVPVDLDLVAHLLHHPVFSLH